MTPAPSTMSADVGSPRSALLQEGALAELAAELLGTRRLWDGFARFDPRERWPVRLLADEHFEAWVIGWCPGQSLGLHDHGGSAAAIVVGDGRLQETAVTATAHGPRRETRVLDRGVVRSIAPRAVHAIANRATRPATSLHLYSPPLDRMTHFDHDGGRAVETVGIDSVAPLLPTTVARLLRIALRVCSPRTRPPRAPAACSRGSCTACRAPLRSLSPRW